MQSILTWTLDDMEKKNCFCANNTRNELGPDAEAVGLYSNIYFV